MRGLLLLMHWLWARSLELKAVILICRPEEEEGTAGAGAVDFKRKEVFNMPGFNGTGPAGMGPMTGRGRGYCNPSQTAYGPATEGGPGYFGPSYAQGFGRDQGSGRGRGFSSGFRPGSGRGQGYGTGIGRRGAYPARRGR